MNPIRTLLGAVVALSIAACGGSTSGSEARELVAGGALLVDVRTPEEYAGGHIDGAVNIPLQELEQRVHELGPDKSRAIVVYCRSGNRSAQARRFLEGHGFTAVHDLGPMSAW